MTFTKNQMKRINEKNGMFWFSDETMKFFGTAVESDTSDQNLFVTSENNFNGTKRFYTVRYFNPSNGEVITVGDFNVMSKAEAFQLKNSLTKALRTAGNREREILKNLSSVEAWEDSPQNCYEFSDGEQSFVIHAGRCEIVN